MLPRRAESIMPSVEIVVSPRRGSDSRRRARVTSHFGRGERLPDMRRTSMERVRCQIASPIDELTLIAEGDALVGVRFADGSGRRWFRNDHEIAVDDAHPVLVRARR